MRGSQEGTSEPPENLPKKPTRSIRHDARQVANNIDLVQGGKLAELHPDQATECSDRYRSECHTHRISACVATTTRPEPLLVRYVDVIAARNAAL